MWNFFYQDALFGVCLLDWNEILFRSHFNYSFMIHCQDKLYL